MQKRRRRWKTAVAKNYKNIPLQEKEMDESVSQVGFGKRNFYDAYYERILLRQQLQGSYGNMQRKDTHKNRQLLYNPYAFRVKKEGDALCARFQDITLSEEETNSTIDDDAFGTWFKITIPNGRDYKKTWLISLLQSHCTVAFTPVDLKYIRNRVQFFIQNPQSAFELRNISYQIRDEENRKIFVYVNASAQPPSVQYKLTPEQLFKLKLIMKKRYNVSKKSLCLKRFRFERELVNCGIDMLMSRRSCMDATLKIIKKHFSELLSLNLSNNRICWLDGLSELIEKAPRVKSLNLSKNWIRTMGELEKVKALKLEELWLEGNPLCNTFSDHSAYVSAALKYFPELSQLDGRKLFPTIDADNLEIIKPRKETYKGLEKLKSLVMQFMLQYYLIYDYGDRRSLFTAYHAEACFSLTITFNPKKPDLRGLEAYFKDSRNIKRLKDSFLRMELLKYKKYNIVTCLYELPQTQHDLNSYVVDLCAETENMICFSVNGLFKEVEGRSAGCIRAFTRIFILTTGKHCRPCIVNDKMILRTASPEEAKNAFFTARPKISFTNQEMKDASTQTDLKYLEDEWNCIGNEDAHYPVETKDGASDEFSRQNF